MIALLQGPGNKGAVNRLLRGDTALNRAFRRPAVLSLSKEQPMKIVLVALAIAVGCISAAIADDQDVTAINIAVIRAEHDRLNRGDWQAATEEFAQDTRNFGKPVGQVGVRNVLEDIYRTFPDWRMEIVDIAATGDSVIVRCKVSGTHRGVGKIPVNGGLLVGVAPTQKHFEVQHIHWYILHGGKIVDHYATRDDIGMMQQLGLLPAVSRPDTK
jgi:predicted ester cyclase